MSDPKVERAISTLKNIIDAAQNANHAGEVAAVLAASAQALVDALEFYADREAEGYYVRVGDYGRRVETGRIIRDGGEIARTAIARAIFHPDPEFKKPKRPKITHTTSHTQDEAKASD